MGRIKGLNPNKRATRSFQESSHSRRTGRGNGRGNDHQHRSPRGRLLRCEGLGEVGAPLPIFLPQPPAILDVETERLAPLDARGRRWPHRPVPLNEKPGGPRRHPGRLPAPMPSRIAGAGPRPPRCTGSSGNTWRRTSPWPMSPILRAMGYRITWRRSSEAI